MTYTWPLPEGTPISQHFGDNPSNGVNPAGGHTGTDFAVPVGTPIRAIGDGVVKFADWANTLPADYRPDGSGPNPYWLAPNFGGIVVVIDHGPVVTVHAHLSDTKLNAGDAVRQGDVIALSGDTGGATTGPHLHFETLPDGWDFNNGTYGRVDPSTFCTAYWPGVQLASSGTITPIDPTPAPIPEDDMSYSQWPNADKIQLYCDIWGLPGGSGGANAGLPGAPLISERSPGTTSAWPETYLGSLRGRIDSDIEAHVDAALKAIPTAASAAGPSALTAADYDAIAARVIAGIKGQWDK